MSQPSEQVERGASEAVVAVEETEKETEKEALQPEVRSQLSELKLASPPEAPDVSNTESGWAALAKSVREIDESVVKDYKEDIDNILVFAGLYSAVLTGLLAISINNLQPDSNDVVISLLRQLTNQTHTYTFSAGFLNSTAPPPDLQPPLFSPSLAAKRVNVLWFASLMLSLMSASFGILVKQWLREFLAGTYSSPEARMRVRYFREPGLRDWKVYGLAACLPLLLQVSLALFFLGLCFYTVDIHLTIGYTTISLALAWAVLFIAISFAPILSPRCPYKTPILRHVTKFLRQSLFNMFDLPYHSNNGAFDSGKKLWAKIHAFSSRCSPPQADTSPVISDAESLSPEKSSEGSSESPPPASPISPTSPASPASLPPPAVLDGPEQPSLASARPSTNWKHTWKIPAKWTWRLLAYDEEDAAPSPANDIDALLTLDAIQRDDRLLLKMCSVLEERHTPLADIVDFVFKVVASRLPPGQVPPTRPVSPIQMVDLTALTPRTCAVLMALLAKALEIEVKKIPISKKIDWDNQAMKESLALLCGRLPCLLSPQASKVLLLCASGHYGNRVVPFMDALMKGVPPEDRFVLGLHLQERLRPMLLQLDGDDFDSHLLHFARIYCNCGKCGSYDQKLVNHRQEMGLLLENHLMEIIMDYFREQTKVPDARWLPYHAGIMTVVHNIWGASNDGTWYSAYVACFTSLLIHATIGPEVASLFYHHTYYSTASMEVCRRSFEDSPDFREGILATMTKSVIAYVKEFHLNASKQHIHPYFMPRMLLFLRLQMNLLKWAIADQNISYIIFCKWYQPQWQAMLLAITPALQLCLTLPDLHAGKDESSDLAGECLERMGEAEAGWKVYLDKESITSPGASLFDKDLVKVICEIAPSDKVAAYYDSRERLNNPQESEPAATEAATEATPGENPHVPRLDTGSSPDNEQPAGDSITLEDNVEPSIPVSAEAGDHISMPLPAVVEHAEESQGGLHSGASSGLPIPSEAVVVSFPIPEITNAIPLSSGAADEYPT